MAHFTHFSSGTSVLMFGNSFSNALRLRSRAASNFGRNGGFFYLVQYHGPEPVSFGSESAAKPRIALSGGCP